MGAITGLTGQMGEPVMNTITQGLLGLFQGGRARARKPDVPSFTAPLSGGRINLTSQQQRLAGGQTSMPLSTNADIAGIQRGYLADSTSYAQSQEEQNSRLLGLSSMIGRNTQTALGQNLGAQSDLASTLSRGGSLFNQARGQIGATRERVNQIAESSLKSTASMVGEFMGIANGLRNDMSTLRGEAMANAKDNAATRLGEATAGVTNQTAQAVSDVSASMYAQGLPATSASDTIGKLLASGMKQNGDLQRQIGIDENTRLSNLERDWGQMSTQLDIALGTTSGNVISSGIAEMGGTMRNLSAQEAALTQYNSQLADAESNWRASVNTTRANMATQYQNLAMSGQNAMMDIHQYVSTPVIALGPIMEAAFGSTTEINNFQYQAELADSGLENAIDNMQFAPWFAGLDNMLQLEELHHQQGFQHRENAQNRALEGGIEGAKVFAALMSDVDTKHDVTVMDHSSTLEAVKELPVSKWKYNSSEREHVGPMAQDFKRVFGLGGDGRTIALVDANGVLLSAVKALIDRVEALEFRLETEGN